MANRIELHLIPFQVNQEPDCIGIDLEKLNKSGRSAGYFYDGKGSGVDFFIVHCFLGDSEQNIDILFDELDKIWAQTKTAKRILVIAVDIRHYERVIHFFEMRLGYDPNTKTTHILDYTELKERIRWCASNTPSADAINILEHKDMTLMAQDIMVVNPWTISPDASLYRAFDKMRQHLIGHLPVVDESGTLSGLLSWTNLLELMPATEADTKEAEEILDQMSKSSVAKRMNTDVTTVYPNAKIKEVLQLLCEPKDNHYISLLPVVEEITRKVVGVISWVDIFHNWSKIPNSKASIDRTAGEIGLAYEQIPKYFFDDTIAFVKHDRQGLAHFLVINQSQEPLCLLTNRDILRYESFIGVNDRRVFNTRIGDVRPMHTLEDITIPGSMLIWKKDDDATVIGKFLQSVDGQKSFNDRYGGVLSLSEDDQGKIQTLITPIDCMKLLLNN
jgi:CBS domain-containing protein